MKIRLNEDAEIVRDIDNAIKKSTLNSGMILYRGSSPSVIGLQTDVRKMTPKELKPLIGKEITDKAFMSTSKVEEKANVFSGRGTKASGNVMLVITVDGNQNGVDVGENSNFGGNEFEVILPRNSKLKITNIKRYINKLTVFADYVGI